MTPNPYIAPRIIDVWHMHLGNKGDPKAMSRLDAPLRTCIADNDR